jgi:membrane protein implicated in regulation of membrane protease activity
MHHLVLILVVLALILFLLLPWRLALLCFAVIVGVFSAIFLLVSRKQRLRTFGAPNRTMIGSRATVVKTRSDGAEVRWQGEIWHAVSTQPLQPGKEVVIEEVDGLTLRVRNPSPSDS